MDSPGQGQTSSPRAWPTPSTRLPRFPRSPSAASSRPSWQRARWSGSSRRSPRRRLLVATSLWPPRRRILQGIGEESRCERIFVIWGRFRFRDVVPYDENRVKITNDKENKLGYVNARLAYHLVMNIWIRRHQLFLQFMCYCHFDNLYLLQSHICDRWRFSKILHRSTGFDWEKTNFQCNLTLPRVLCWKHFSILFYTIHCSLKLLPRVLWPTQCTTSGQWSKSAMFISSSCWLRCPAPRR